ncbi:hypothetical protein BB14905_05233 [Bacillus sp. B14905]|nr:hypothetical protein BB14905_05233 [Bacillus sp. B14905]
MRTPFKIQEQMNALMSWNGREAQALHPIVRGALLHAIFIGIHPFIDGNGRTSRLLLNLELMKFGYEHYFSNRKSIGVLRCIRQSTYDRGLWEICRACCEGS